MIETGAARVSPRPKVDFTRQEGRSAGPEIETEYLTVGQTRL
jgi:hypothetical protein